VKTIKLQISRFFHPQLSQTKFESQHERGGKFEIWTILALNYWSYADSF